MIAFKIDTILLVMDDMMFEICQQVEIILYP